MQFKDHLKSPSLVKHGTIIDSNLAMSNQVNQVNTPNPNQSMPEFIWQGIAYFWWV